MTMRNCYVQDVGIAIEKLADALDHERSKPFRGDILDLLEWATKDTLAMRQQLTSRDAEMTEKIKPARKRLGTFPNLHDPRTILVEILSWVIVVIGLAALLVMTGSHFG